MTRPSERTAMRDRIPLSEKPVWNIADMCAAFDIHRNTLRRWEQTGALPKSIQLEGRKVWLRSRVEDFLERLAG